jgi:hypothetical protein
MPTVPPPPWRAHQAQKYRIVNEIRPPRASKLIAASS